jgi:hypothetical protein
MGLIATAIPAIKSIYMTELMISHDLAANIRRCSINDICERRDAHQPARSGPSGSRLTRSGVKNMGGAGWAAEFQAPTRRSGQRRTCEINVTPFYRRDAEGAAHHIFRLGSSGLFATTSTSAYRSAGLDRRAAATAPTNQCSSCVKPDLTLAVRRERHDAARLTQPGISRSYHR